MGNNYYDKRSLYSDVELIAAYKENGTLKKAADSLGVSGETVRRALKRNGIKADGYKNNGYHKGVEHGYGTPIKVTDEEIISECKYLTIDEIAEKHGMHRESLPRRFKRLGVEPVGYKDHYRKTGHLAHYKSNLPQPQKRFGECWHYIKSHDELVKEKHPGFIYLESRKNNSTRRVRLKCKTCGAVIERAASTVRQKGIECDGCKEQKQKQIAISNAVNVLNKIALSKTPRTCECCGKTFYSIYASQKYCSDKCKRIAKGGSMRHRVKKHNGRIIDKDITLKKVFMRDNGICQICGKPCDWDDHSWGNIGPLYPTRDHIIALANGGEHSWNNIQLAHAMCNSVKRDLA